MNTRLLWFKNALAKILGFLGFKSKLDNQTQESNNDLIKDLLDKSKPLRMIKKEEFSDELISKIIGYKNNNKNKNENIKLWVDNASEDLNQALGLKNAKITMQSYAMKHIFNRHGVNSELAKEGQPPITNQDLRDYSSIVNNADIHGIGRGKRGEKALVSGKQINGYHIIVETISKRNNELMLKTMYKENGRLMDNRAIKKAETLLSSNKRTANSPDAKVNGIGLDSTDATAISNYNTNQPKNQEKPSKLGEAMEELEKIREENHKERNLSESQNLTQVNPNDSSAMDEFRKEYQESQKQEESKQEMQTQQDDNVRRQK